MAKKEKSPEELIMELMTKLKNIFKSDLYIKDKLYIFGGILSDDEVFGDVMCIVEPKYKLAIEEYFDDCKLIYIDDVTEFKVSPIEHIDYTRPEKDYQDLQKQQDRLMKNIDQVKEWKSFSTKPQELLNLIFDRNTSVDYKETEDGSYITLCKRLFPLVTLKNIENLYYEFHPYITDLETMNLDFHFTHFRVYMVYYFLETK